MSRPNLRATQANAAPAIFLELSAHGSDIAPDQRSPLRRAVLLSAAFLLLVSAPLYWAGAAQGSEGEQPQAVVSKSGPNEGEDEGDDDGDAGTDLDTGAETQGNTDAGTDAQFTGPSTVGETDPTDTTGATEQIQGTGAETQGKHRRRSERPVHRSLEGGRDRSQRRHRGHGADAGHWRGDARSDRPARGHRRLHNRRDRPERRHGTDRAALDGRSRARPTVG